MTSECVFISPLAFLGQSLMKAPFTSIPGSRNKVGHQLKQSVSRRLQAIEDPWRHDTHHAPHQYQINIMIGSAVAQRTLHDINGQPLACRTALVLTPISGHIFSVMDSAPPVEDQLIGEFKMVATLAVQPVAQIGLAPLPGGDPFAHDKRWLMAYMLRMPAIQPGQPVSVLIAIKSDHGALHDTHPALARLTSFPHASVSTRTARRPSAASSRLTDPLRDLRACLHPDTAACWAHRSTARHPAADLSYQR